MSLAVKLALRRFAKVAFAGLIPAAIAYLGYLGSNLSDAGIPLFLVPVIGAGLAAAEKWVKERGKGL